ncbi:MAG: NADH-quinone oxidoreductase subunit J family protein, partial [bacterium]
VYVGAVIVLIIFAVMLTAKVGNDVSSQTNRLALPAALGAVALFVVLQHWLLETSWAVAQASPAADQQAMAGSLNNLQVLGLTLFTRYVYPLELTALILFTALIGAVLIARKDQA